jgi:hypothetical protein
MVASECYVCNDNKNRLIQADKIYILWFNKSYWTEGMILRNKTEEKTIVNSMFLSDLKVAFNDRNTILNSHLTLC